MMVSSAALSHLNDIMTFADSLEIIEKTAYMKVNVHKYESRILLKKEELEKYQTRKLHLYDDLKDGILEKEEYLMFKNEYDRKISEIQNEITGFENDMNMILENNSASQNWIKEFEKYRGSLEFTRNMVSVMIDKVFVYDTDRIEMFSARVS